MILFLQDWSRYPGSKPNYDTKNESYLKLAGTYYAMGIKNYAFMLALHDQSLKDVDPFSPLLTELEMIKIAIVSNVPSEPSPEVLATPTMPLPLVIVYVVVDISLNVTV
jgi:hypothetical protein